MMRAAAHACARVCATAARPVALPAFAAAAPVRCMSAAVSGASVGSGAAAAAPPPPLSAEAAAPTVHRKIKNSFKRTSAVMADVERDTRLRMALKIEDFRPPLPAFNVGDAVEITYVQEHTESRPVPVRGTVIAKTRKGMDSKFTIINAWDDEWYTATYPYASPLLRGMKIMMRNRFTEGEKGARRAKLNFLYERDPKTYSVDAQTKEYSEINREKMERRALAKAGKQVKKTKGGAGAAAAAAKGKPAAGAGKGGDKKAAKK